MSFLFSPSAGSTLKVTISSTPTLIHGCEGIPNYGAEKPTYDTTSIDDIAKTFGVDMADYGEVTLTGIWDSTDPGQAYLLGQAAPGVSAVDTFTATYQKKAGATTAATGVFTALVTSFQVAAVKGGPQKFTSKLKLTGTATWTAAA